jgi:hypothetical protein
MTVKYLKIALDIIGFQVIWFACALGVPHGYTWTVFPLGALYLAQHLYFSNDRGFEISLIIKGTLLGIVFDTSLMWINAVQFTNSNLWVQPFWMTTLWASFGASLSSSFSWLKSRYLLGAILGGLIGPISYYGGEKLGALSIHGMNGFIALSICWTIAMPIAISWLSQKRLGPTSKSHNESPS